MSWVADLGYIGLTLAGLAGSALCAGTETGVYSLNRVRLTVRQQHAAPGGGVGPAGGATAGTRAARILKAEIDRPDRMLATLLIGNTIFGSLSATGITGLLESAGYSDRAIILMNVAVLTPLLFVFGENLPKEVFRAGADVLTYRFAWFLRALRLVLTWTLVLPVVTFVAQRLARLLGAGDETALLSARDRMAALLKEGAHHGVLSEAQTTLLDRALALRNTEVGDEMVPWSKARTLSTRWDRARALETLRQTPFSRFPLVDPSGRVVGVIENLDVCLKPDATLAGLARPPLFLDPGMTVREGLVRLRDAGAKMAVVVAGGGGKGGRPIGIVTAKDLVEPLTGELEAW